VTIRWPLHPIYYLLNNTRGPVAGSNHRQEKSSDIFRLRARKIA